MVGPATGIPMKSTHRYRSGSPANTHNIGVSWVQVMVSRPMGHTWVTTSMSSWQFSTALFNQPPSHHWPPPLSTTIMMVCVVVMVALHHPPHLTHPTDTCVHLPPAPSTPLWPPPSMVMTTVYVIVVVALHPPPPSSAPPIAFAAGAPLAYSRDCISRRTRRRGKCA